MTSELKAAQNKINATRSTGPRTSRGKMRSSMNARKHGRRSEREKVLRGDSYNSEVRRMKWMLGCDPKSDMEEFVVAENVNFSFELELRTRCAPRRDYHADQECRLART